MSIALDTFSQATGGAGNISWSHTCTGTNLILFVGIEIGHGTGTGSVSAVTYNGVSMTQIASVQSSGAGGTMYMFYLLNPATGSHTIQATNTASASAGVSHSYTGVRQSGVPDASTTSTGSGTKISTITTVAISCWAVIMGSGSPSSNVTNRTTADNILTSGDSNGALTAGSHSMTTTDPGSYQGVIMASFAPASITASVLDIVTGTETITTQRGAIKTILDTITSTEIMTAIRGRVVTILDTITSTDVFTSIIRWIRGTKSSTNMSTSSRHNSTWTDSNKDSSIFTNPPKS